MISLISLFPVPHKSMSRMADLDVFVQAFRRKGDN